MVGKAKAKELLFRFNIQNLKWALLENGQYDTPKKYGTSKKLTLDSEVSVKKLYGDGKRIASIMNDKGKNAIWTTNNINDNFEIDMGRKIRLKKGLASIQQQDIKTFAFYFETTGLDEDNSMPLAKTWVFGATSTVAPSESYEQTTDDPNESQYETSIEIGGVALKNADGSIYKNPKTGQEVRVWYLMSTPDCDDFETFGDSVPIPTIEEVNDDTTEDVDNDSHDTANSNQNA